MDTITACPRDKGDKVSETQGLAKSQGRCKARAEVLPPALPCTQESRASHDLGRNAGHTCHHAQHAPTAGRKLGTQLGTTEHSADKANSILQPSFTPVLLSFHSRSLGPEERSYLSYQVWTPLERDGLPHLGPSVGSVAPPHQPPCRCPGSRSAVLCLTLCLQPPSRKCFLLPVV